MTMADDIIPGTATPKVRKATSKGDAVKPKGPAKAASLKTAAIARSADPALAPAPVAPVAEAKSRFNAALEEAKAGAAALRTEAETRLGNVSEQAKGKSSDLVAEARNYGEQALGKAGEFAVEGKKTASDAIASIGKAVGESASQIDEKLGEQYGDYARKASRSLVETSAKLEAKSVEELGEDARAMVRKSPGVAVGIATVFGFFLARMLRGKRR